MHGIAASETETIRRESQALAPALVGIRRLLHRRPEIGLRLPISQRVVVDELAGLNLEVRKGDSSSSVTAVLRGAENGPTVLLRGDMDGLPLTEETGLEFASEVSGAMHACGHDLHTAILIGAARVLAANREKLAGDVIFMFQPGEEGCDGAAHMIAEGVLDATGRRADAAYGLHVMAAIDKGIFSTRPGVFMASNATLTATVEGEGGHGATPHLAKDPITVAAQILVSLQTAITRRFDAFDPVVVTPGQFHAGTADNIIPRTAVFVATVRTFSSENQDRAEVELVRVCREIGAAYDVEVVVEFARGYPPTINDSNHAEFAKCVVEETFGTARFALMAAPHPGAEDFSRVLAEVPGCYLMLGARVSPSDGSQSAPENHSPKVLFDESVIPDGTALLSLLAMRALRRDSVL